MRGPHSPRIDCSKQILPASANSDGPAKISQSTFQTSYRRTVTILVRFCACTRYIGSLVVRMMLKDLFFFFFFFCSAHGAP